MRLSGRAIGLAVALCALIAPDARALAIETDDPNLQFIGRWETKANADPWLFHKGGALVARFTGTSFAATLTVVSGEYFRVIVDGDDAASAKVSFTSGVPLMLASGLSPGAHTLELIKETDQGRATLTAVEIDDGSVLLAPPPRPSRRMVFYGDSNLAGYSLESERNLGGSQYVGSHRGYAGVTARMFGAEYQNVSRSGATIQSLNASYDRVDWTTMNPKWDFGSYPVDVVVVNIGANDTFTPKATNKMRYQALLDDLRIDHPDAHIMLYNAYGWDFNEPASYIGEVIAERGDPNMSWAVFPWVFEQFHGCQTDHAGMAQYLALHLRDVLGWDADWQDVMSGYGRRGNVANGSFERRAPFGGWGWRYFDDPGVSRIHDPAGAQDGGYFLRLTDGASSHQTNPAEDGSVVNATMWMRGGVAGDGVDVTISFRDQGGGGEVNSPLASTTQSFVLTTSWQKYTMSVAAPAAPPNPVYSARIAFVAGAGETVDVDAVITGPEEVANLRWLDSATMVWDALPTAVEYHVYGGPLSSLAANHAGECLDARDTDRTDTMLADPTLPPAGEVDFYLVTGQDAGGNEGPLEMTRYGPRTGGSACP